MKSAIDELFPIAAATFRELVLKDDLFAIIPFSMQIENGIGIP
jgi:hypothetical protein